MKKLLIKILLFAVLIALIDRPFILFKYRLINVFAEISRNKLVSLRGYLDSNHIKSVDISVYGSSHPQFGISPEIIGKITNKSCINFAYGGGTNIGAQYHFINELAIPTKVMVYAIDVFSLNEKPELSDGFQDAFFTKRENMKEQEELVFNNDITSLSGQVLKYSNIFMYAHFIPKYAKDVLHGNITPPYLRKEKTPDLQVFSQYYGYNITPAGWVQGNGYANTKYYRFPDYVFNPDRDAIASLRSIIDYCRQRNIKLFIVQVPEHIVALNYKQKYIDFDKWMNRFATENKVTYLDFDRQDAFPVSNDSLFYDTDHLNKQGAELFSEMLAKRLSQEGI